MKSSTKVALLMIAIFFVALLATFATAGNKKPKGEAISLLQEQTDSCAAEGGCAVISKKDMRSIANYISAANEALISARQTVKTGCVGKSI